MPAELILPVVTPPKAATLRGLFLLSKQGFYSADRTDNPAESARERVAEVALRQDRLRRTNVLHEVVQEPLHVEALDQVVQLEPVAHVEDFERHDVAVLVQVHEPASPDIDCPLDGLTGHDDGQRVHLGVRLSLPG